MIRSLEKRRFLILIFVPLSIIFLGFVFLPNTFFFSPSLHFTSFILLFLNLLNLTLVQISSGFTNNKILYKSHATRASVVASTSPVPPPTLTSIGASGPASGSQDTFWDSPLQFVTEAQKEASWEDQL